MNSLNRKSLLIRCIFILVIVFLFVGTFPQAPQVTPALALTATPSAPPTRTRTPTRPPTCIPGTLPLPPRVQPVTSPTNALTQLVSMNGAGYVKMTVAVATSAGTTTYEDTTSPFSVTINLTANTTHNLTVTGTVSSCNGTFNLSSTKDINGGPLTIVQTTGPVITNTPTQGMISPVTISGHVNVGSSSGMGLAGITILHAFGPSPMTFATITDSNGFYTFTKDTMGHQETNNVAAQPGSMGYTFSPVSYQFISQTTGGTFVRDFIANSPTITNTPVVTNTPVCFPASPSPAARVNPVTSPTNQLTQVITFADPVPSSYSAMQVSVSTASSSTTYTDDTAPFAVTITLQPNTTNNVSVNARIGTGPCAGGTSFTSFDLNGNSLAITHSSTLTLTPTRTLTPTPTITCPTGTPAPAPRVNPVTSPTNALTQVISVQGTGYSAVNVFVSTTSGSTTFTDTTAPFDVTVNLQPNTTNNISVNARIGTGPCVGGTLSTNRDINGNPLTIVQQSGTIVPTRTNTPFPDPTPISGYCNPVNATITAPFTFDGAGTFCWKISNIPSFINSWNLNSLTVNGVNWTNLWASPSQLPAKAPDGYWYISYNSSVAWGHFEAK